jgi:hypothetical protein
VKRLIHVSVLVALLGATAAMSASAKVLEQGRLAGYSFATVGVFHPHLLGFKITSGSQTPLRVQVQLKCLKAHPQRQRWYPSERKLIATPPIKRRLPLPVRNASGCAFSVSAHRPPSVPQFRSWIKVTLKGRASQVFRPLKPH